MSEIYVPIDFSNVYSVIPAGEDILYSTLCRGTSLSSTVTKLVRRYWVAHVLITNKRLAFNIPRDIRFNPMNIKSKNLNNVDLSGEDEYYVPLRKVVFIGKRLGVNLDEDNNIDSSEALKRGEPTAPVYYLKLARNPNFETNRKFKERSSQFKQKFLPLVKHLRLKFYKETYEIFNNYPEITVEGYREKFGPIQDNMFLKIKKKWEKGQPPETLWFVKGAK